MITQASETTGNKRIVMVATDVPEEIVRRAQLMIVTGESWHIICPGQRAHGKNEAAPQVACPIVDISAVEDDEQVAELMKLCVLPIAGVVAMETLINGLTKLGATVKNRPCAVCVVTQKNCADCIYGVIQ